MLCLCKNTDYNPAWSKTVGKMIYHRSKLLLIRPMAQMLCRVPRAVSHTDCMSAG